MPDISRPLTDGEKQLAHSLYRGAIRLDEVRIKRRKWFPFQPRNVLMAPCGHVHVHPKSHLWSEDYSQEHMGLQGLLLHELCHVWQAQQRGKYYLPLMRHPFCTYNYTIKPGREFERYGLEQQAELVRHTFLLRNKYPLTGAPPLAQIESILPFNRPGGSPERP
ncbi:MAG: vgr related protein [Sphingosinicella sp.]|nr:vgr related protein [Sphingosinicella sp.]